MLVIAGLGTYLLPQYRASFEASLPAALATCAVQAKVLNAEGNLAYGDPPDAAAALELFQADTVLRISDLDRPYLAPSPDTVTFLLTLSDAHTGRPVWRRQEQLQLIGAWFGLVDLGHSFASRVVSVMSGGGAIKGCKNA